ncbi:MAG: hypothetical protein ACSLE6_10565 [Mycobacterium sp.]
MPLTEGANAPDVDSETARRAIREALLGRPRVVLMAARDEVHFVETLFGSDAAATRVHMSTQTRNGTERGPHFDLYQSMVDPRFPFLATFNLAGAATVESAELDPGLTAYYFKHYPTINESAHKARRFVSALGLQQPGVRTETQHLGEGVGMFIPQLHNAYPVIHEVRPLESGSPLSHGVFHKFIVPRDDESARKALAGQGFERWQSGEANATAEVSAPRRQVDPQKYD